jgi:hypothetical protein
MHLSVFILHRLTASRNVLSHRGNRAWGLLKVGKWSLRNGDGLRAETTAGRLLGSCQPPTLTGKCRTNRLPGITAFPVICFIKKACWLPRTDRVNAGA